VTFMTLHSAKGLEFPWVFIAGLEEGLLPHSRSIFSPEEMEEERRLFYVAVTRAREQLYLVVPMTRRTPRGTVVTRPSLFIRELPRERYETWRASENLLLQEQDDSWLSD